MDELTGKVAVVTGAASGIGLALAEAFAAEGMRLALADCEEAALTAAAERLSEAGADVLAVTTDTARAESVDALADQVRRRYGTSHVVCNNAGVGGHGFPSWSGPRAEWEWVLGVNLWGVINGVRAFVPMLLAQNEGHVVNTASLAGLGTIPFMAPYSASKHAVLAISEALYHELAMHGSAVKVSVLCPGFVNTRIVESPRNWPQHLGPPPESWSPASEFMEQIVREAVASGLPPSQLAQKVVDAVRTGRFMVLTDEALARSAVEGVLGELGGENPTLPGLL